MINPEEHGLPNLVEVKIDMRNHPGQTEPTDRLERLTWAYMDTAYNLLRVGAVRAVLEDLREEGAPLPADEVLFNEPDGPQTYLDLAPDDDLAAYGLFQVFGRLLEQISQVVEVAVQDAADIDSL